MVSNNFISIFMRDATMHYCFALLATANNHKTPAEGQHKKTWLVIPEYKKLWSLHWGKNKEAEQMSTRAVGKQHWQPDLPEDGNEEPCITKASKANPSTWVHSGSRFCPQQRWDEFYFPAASLEEFWMTCSRGFSWSVLLLCLCCLLRAEQELWLHTVQPTSHLSLVLPDIRASLLKQHCGPQSAPLCIRNL